MLRVGIFFVFLLSGCLRSLPPPTLDLYELDREAGIAPTQEEALLGVRTYLTERLKDPDSIKQFRITAPIEQFRWVIPPEISGS